MGQASILKNVLKNIFEDTKIDFSTIGLIEAHGTGTTAGDQVEIESFKKISESNTTAIPIGSIKGNIGHAGVTSAGPALIKAALALKKAKIPPSVNCSDPSEHLKQTKFYVNTEMKEWISGDKERRALVHSIGAMGSNAATILEQYQGSSYQKSSSNESEIIPFPACISANSDHSLREFLSSLHCHLSLNTSLSLNSLAYTLLYTRRFLPLRVTHVYYTKEDFAEWLLSSVHDVSVSKNRKLCCAMFSGQGALINSKSLRILSKSLPRFGEEICNCFDLLKKISSDLTYCSLHQLTQLNNSTTTVTAMEDLERKVAKSVCLQTTLIIVSAQIALYHSLKHLGLKANYFQIVGHSLGEYTAAHMAGVFSVKDILYLVYERGKLIENYTDRGEMLSIAASPNEMMEMCSRDHKGVHVSCLNSPRHCVASGTPKDVGRLSSVLTSQQIQHKKLKIDYAYHHPSMAVIQRRFSTILKKTTIHALNANLITSTAGHVRMHTAGAYLSTDYWLKHLVTPCDFLSTVIDCLSIQCKDFVFVEMGLVPTLAHFVKSCNTELGSACVSVSIKSRNDTQKLENLLLTDLTNVWKLGINFELHRLPCFKNAKRIKLPLYPFDTKQYWKEPDQKSSDHTPSTTLECKVNDTQPLSRDSVLEVIRRFTGPDYDSSLPVDSLLLVSLENKLFNCFGVSVVCKHDTDPKALADFIVSQHNVARNVDPEVTVTLLSPPSAEPDRKNIFIINVVDKKRHSFVPLAMMFSPHFNVYGLYAPTTIFKLKRIKDYAQLYLKEIRKKQKQGTFILGGFSFGAWVAHSIVRELESEGKELPTVLFLIDPPQFSLEVDHFSSKLSSLISLGLGSVRTFTISPVKDTIIQFGNRFQEETKLLMKYQVSPTKISCPALVFLAMERMAFAYEQSDEISMKEYWSKWCIKETLNIKMIPGHHGTCFSFFNGQHIIRDILQALPMEQVENYQQYIPVCSPD